MKLVNNNMIDFKLKEGSEPGLYDVTIYFNMIKYKGVYSPIVGFIYSSLYDEDALLEVSNEIKKVLIKESTM